MTILTCSLGDGEEVQEKRLEVGLLNFLDGGVLSNDVGKLRLLALRSFLMA